MKKKTSNLRILFLYHFYKRTFKEQMIRDLLNNHQFDFIPTQRKVSLPILYRIYMKMKLGISFTGIMCNDNLLIEGHHRHICSILTNTQLDIIPYHNMRNVQKYEWKDVIIDPIDYDSEKDKKKYNLQNSRKDNIDRELFNKLF